MTAVCVQVRHLVYGDFLEPVPSVTDLSTCAYVIETGAPSAWVELGNMSIENAELIGGCVGGLWALAWSLKAIRKSIPSFESPES